MEVGVQAPRKPAREERPPWVDRQRDPEERVSASPPSASTTRRAVKVHAGQPAQAQADIDEMGEDPGPHQRGRPREASPAPS